MLSEYFELPHRIDDGDSQTKNHKKTSFFDYIFGYFYCTVVPTVSKPLFSIFIAALMSRLWYFPHLEHFQFRIPNFPIPLMFLFFSLQLLHICVDAKDLGTFTNSTLFQCALFSIMSMNVRGAFICSFLLRFLSFFQFMMFSF